MAVYDINGNLLTEDASIKSYYENEMADTISKVRNLNTEPALVFPVVTDIHRYSEGVTQTFPEMINNIRHFAGVIKCDFIANTGDTIDGNATQDITLGYAYDCTEQLQDIGIPFLYSQGNHDNNPYNPDGSLGNNQFSIQQVFKGFYCATKDVTFNFNENGTDYYIDYGGLGIRVVMLNACNVKKDKKYAYGDSTATWLTNTALDTDHTVLLMEHLSSIASQVWNNNHGTNADAVTSALTSFVNNGGTLVQISGHSHIDLAFVQPWLSVMHNCQKFIVSDITTTQFAKIT